jgi:hypothetical protein
MPQDKFNLNIQLMCGQAILHVPRPMSADDWDSLWAYLHFVEDKYRPVLVTDAIVPPEKDMEGRDD